MKMMARILATVAVLGVMMISGCSSEEPPDEVAETTHTAAKPIVPPTTAPTPTPPSNDSVIQPASAVEPAEPEKANAGDQTPNAAAPAANTDLAPEANTPEQFLAQIDELKKTRFQSVAELTETMDSILTLSQKVLNANPADAQRDQAREATFQAIHALTRYAPNRTELLETVDQLAEQVVADAPESPAAASAYFYQVMTHLNIERNDSENDPEINRRLFAMAKDFATKFPEDERAGMALYEIGQNAQMDQQMDTAREILAYLVELDPDSQFATSAAGTLRRLDAIGKPVEIAGPTLDGSELDINQFKGKVVLVDFWATWCGPCVQELPNVQKVYKQYHDQGFEIIGVSFDQTKEALAKFVQEKEMPWAQIFFDEEGKRFWDNPLGRHYGINSIPSTFLVDRQGKLQKIGVRGPALEPAVVELLNASQE